MKISTRSIPVNHSLPFRRVESGDASILADLMDGAYRGTIDFEGETPRQCLTEIESMFSGKYGPFLDFASFVLTSESSAESARALSATLVSHWKERPLLILAMTAPEAQGKGLAGSLIERSISALAERGYPELHLAVTFGNLPAERLYRRLGFVTYETYQAQAIPSPLLKPTAIC
jgi:GNAT superfamily N-acetyltransferase